MIMSPLSPNCSPDAKNEVQLQSSHVVSLLPPLSNVQLTLPDVPTLNGVVSKQPSPPMVRCEDYFFKDANLVLVSNENLAFGVHRGILQRLSTVFSDMFEIPETSSESEMFEGLPFVRLHDSTADIRTFLQVVYDHKPVEAIEAPHKNLLPFCDKYAIDSISRKILRLLLQTFPDTLEAWNRPRNTDQIQEAVNVAIVAFKLNINILIPACLYTIMSGDYPSLENDLYKLPQRLLLQYYCGFAEFSVYVIRFHKFTMLYRIGSPAECSKSKCVKLWSVFRGQVEEICLRNPDYVRHPKPLSYLQRLSYVFFGQGGFHNYCALCQASLHTMFEECQNTVWDSLPRVFRVAKDWETLRSENA